MSQKELTEKHSSIVQVDETTGSLTILNPQAKDGDRKMFTFDYAFASDCKQTDVYNKTARPIVDAVLNGYNGTIFAYGMDP